MRKNKFTTEKTFRNILEKQIIKATKDFAKSNNIHFDKMTEYMILNTIREVTSYYELKKDISTLIENFNKK